jgi:hypothetical protein
LKRLNILEAFNLLPYSAHPNPTQPNRFKILVVKPDLPPVIIMKDFKDINATLYFLRQDDLFKKVKPYSLSYDTVDVPRSNLKSQKVTDLLIKDMRAEDAGYDFDKNGIEMVKYEDRMKYEDWFDQKKVEDIYCEDLGKALIKRLGCSSVQIFDTLVSYRNEIILIFHSILAGSQAPPIFPGFFYGSNY